MKRIAVSVSNDVLFDQRVAKTCASLKKADYHVHLIGRKHRGKVLLKRDYPVDYIRVWPRTGFWFYAIFNIKLFFRLVFLRVDGYWANDLDTLPANALAAVIRRKYLFYDSHELFTELPELENKPVVKSIWTFWERLCIPHCDMVITVNESIAGILRSKYQVKQIHVVRNLADSSTVFHQVSRNRIATYVDDFIVVVAGRGINIDRGGEELIEAVRITEGVSAVFVGGGDMWEKLQAMVLSQALTDRVRFIPALAYSDMIGHIAAGDLGLSLDKPKHANYRFSLPNKVFDYSLAGLPLLASRVKEVANLVESHELGHLVDEVSAVHIAAGIDRMRQNPDLRDEYARNAKNLVRSLNWQTEFEPIIKTLNERFKA